MMEVKAAALIIVVLGTLRHLEACSLVPNNGRFCVPSSRPVSNMRRMLLTSDNIRYFASSLHSSVNTEGRVIHVGPVPTFAVLLEVPLGNIDPRATITITVGLDKSHPNTAGIDSDLHVGISDGTTDNVQYMNDVSNYPTAPCGPVNAQNDNIQISTGTTVPATFKLIFTPFYKYGACETAQEGGYINTGTFNNQIDTSKPLFLRWSSGNDAGEEYFVHFFDVEIY